MKRTVFIIAVGCFLGIAIPRSLVAVTDRFSSFDLWPALGERHFLSTPSSQGLYKLQYTFDLSNSYLIRPLDLRNAAGGRIRSVIGYSLGHFFSAGIGITDFWQAGFTLPFFSIARFEPTTDPSPGPSNVTKVGDLKIATKIRAIDSNRYRWGLAFEPFVTIPLGADDSYLGDSKVMGGLKAIGDFLATERIRLTLNLGAELRGERVVINNINFNHRFLAGLGVSARLGRQFTASVEAQANTNMGDFFVNRDTTPVEFIGGVQWEVGQTGLRVAAGGGSCAVCGAKGALGRGFLNLAYRPTGGSVALKERKDAEMREVVLKGGGESERFAEEILALRENCPADPSEYDPEIHDAGCPKYFRLKEAVISLGQEIPETDDARFSDVVLALKKNCPVSPAQFNPEVHDAGCPRFFAVRDEVISLGVTDLKLKEQIVSLGGEAKQEKFSEVMLSLKKNCPSDPADFDPETHDAGCPKFFKLRQEVIALKVTTAPVSEKPQVDRKSAALLKTLKKKDKDHDGIPDAFDDCPTYAEDLNGLADTDGCPEGIIRVTRDELVTIAPVYFGFNRLELSKEAIEVLRHVAEALSHLADITRMEVVGHTDIVGTPSANRRVSLLRAQRVVEHLQMRGISKGVQLTPVGVGAQDPAAPNVTPEGRRRNRRVIFRILNGK